MTEPDSINSMVGRLRRGRLENSFQAILMAGLPPHDLRMLNYPVICG